MHQTQSSQSEPVVVSLMAWQVKMEIENVTPTSHSLKARSSVAALASEAGVNILPYDNPLL